MEDALVDVPRDGTPSTIKLLRDLTESPIIITEDITNLTVDLDGHNLTGDKTGPVFTVEGNMTLADNSEDQNGVVSGGNPSGITGGIVDVKRGEFILDSGTISGSAIGVNVSGKDAKFIMNGGKIGPCVSTDPATVSAGVLANGSVAIKDGEIENTASGAYSILTKNGATVAQDKKYVEGGIIDGNVSTVGIDSTGTPVYDDATVAVYVSGGWFSAEIADNGITNKPIVASLGTPKSVSLPDVAPKDECSNTVTSVVDPEGIPVYKIITYHRGPNQDPTASGEEEIHYDLPDNKYLKVAVSDNLFPPKDPTYVFKG